VACTPCPHGKSKRNCAKCNACPHGKLKYTCAACKSARAGQPGSPEIKQEPEIKLEPEIKQAYHDSRLLWV
jgi:hypothetical protein